MGDGFQLPSLHAELDPHAHDIATLALLLLLGGDLSPPPWPHVCITVEGPP